MVEVSMAADLEIRGFLLYFSRASPMYAQARKFISVRAFGALAFVVSLDLQGIFHGFKDTKTPVFCLGFGNFTALILFPVLIYYCGLGVSGAAMSAVVSQCFSNRENASVPVTMTIATSMEALQGLVAMAAHQICFQVWLDVLLLTDTLTASSQVLGTMQQMQNTLEPASAYDYQTILVQLVKSDLK